jgi:hypothetical protein
MIKLGADALARALHHLAILQGVQIGMDSVGREDMRAVNVAELTHDDVTDALVKLRAEATLLDSPVTIVAIDRLVRNLSDKATPLRHDDLVSSCEQIQSRLIDEIATRHVFVLSAKQRQYFEIAGFGTRLRRSFLRLYTIWTKPVNV